MEQLAAIFGQLSEDLVSIWNRSELAPLYRVFVRPSWIFGVTTHFLGEACDTATQRLV